MASGRAVWGEWGRRSVFTAHAFGPVEKTVVRQFVAWLFEIRGITMVLAKSIVEVV